MELRDYILGVFAIVAALTLIALLRAPSPTERAERVAFTVICIATLAAPTVNTVRHLGTLLAKPESIPPTVQGTLLEGAAEDAFAEGVRTAIATEFSLDRSEIGVTVRGFSLKTGRAEQITVLLRSGAIGVDHRAVERYIEKEGWGTCDVRREAG